MLLEKSGLELEENPRRSLEASESKTLRLEPNRSALALVGELNPRFDEPVSVPGFEAPNRDSLDGDRSVPSIGTKGGSDFSRVTGAFRIPRGAVNPLLFDCWPKTIPVDTNTSNETINSFMELLQITIFSDSTSI
jgi:hypothetical protein